MNRHALNKEAGGEIFVYQAQEIEETRRKELLGVLEWAATAVCVIGEANEIKAACVADADNSLEDIFWEIYQEHRTA